MKLLRFWLLPLLLGVFLLFFQKCSSAQDFKVVGYLPEYRFDIADQIEWKALTHVCIGFAHPGNAGDLAMETEGLRAVINMAHDADVKVMLSLAGGLMLEEDENAWSRYTRPFYRTIFINSLLEFIQFYGIDGVDVDLEFKHVTSNYSDFVLELRDSLKTHNKLLSAALPGIVRYKHLSDKALKAFDFVNVMAYDFTGPFDPNSPGQHSPYDRSMRTIDFWKRQGLSRNKIILGVPFFGWDFSDRKAVKSVTFASLVERDSSFAHLDQVGDIYYNGIPLIEAKTETAIKKSGGIMIWELGQDDYTGFSLLSRINKVLIRKDVRKPEETEVITIEPEAPTEQKKQELTLTYPNFDEFYVIVDNRNSEKDITNEGKIIGETMVKEDKHQQERLELNKLGERITLGFKVEGMKKGFVSIPDYPPGLYLGLKMVKELLLKDEARDRSRPFTLDAGEEKD